VVTLWLNILKENSEKYLNLYLVIITFIISIVFNYEKIFY